MERIYRIQNMALAAPAALASPRGIDDELPEPSSAAPDGTRAGVTAVDFENVGRHYRLAGPASYGVSLYAAYTPYGGYGLNTLTRLLLHGQSSVTAQSPGKNFFEGSFTAYPNPV